MFLPLNKLVVVELKCEMQSDLDVFKATCPYSKESKTVIQGQSELLTNEGGTLKNIVMKIGGLRQLFMVIPKPES